MKNNILFFIGLAVILFVPIFLDYDNSLTAQEDSSGLEQPIQEIKSPEPNDYWHMVRSYPFGFNEQEYIQRINELKASALAPSSKAIILNSPWSEEGPGNIGGRFNALAISPTNQNIIYAGACNGGVFKTIDGGTTWNPIFDANAFLAVGSIELDPSDENTIYVGTGDKNFGGGSHLGNGVYRSTDAGVNWTQIGLE